MKHEPTPNKRTITKQNRLDVEKALRASDLYTVLEVTKTATVTEIKKAYKKKALLLHPDRNPDERAADAFKRVNRAYDTLINPLKKNAYDMTGRESDAAGSATHAEYFHEGDIGSVFEHLFQGFVGVDNPFMGAHRFSRSSSFNSNYFNQAGGNFSSGSQGPKFNLLFILVLAFTFFQILKAFFGGIDWSSPKYNLNATNDTPYGTMTENYKVPYYVNKRFESSYPHNSDARKKIEAEVDFAVYSAQCECNLKRLRRDLYFAQLTNNSLMERETRAKIRDVKKTNEACVICNKISSQYPSSVNKVLNRTSPVSD
ncbi:dnaJ homolog subfamily B member 14-like [Dermatophagoides farinae]|uniref:dnaJ homolog subfamily B member 14-like n=1 Tax=Dermatophagoides farinae TaxID=6954 RepID=UPI003F624884